MWSCWQLHFSGAGKRRVFAGGRCARCSEAPEPARLAGRHEVGPRTPRPPGGGESGGSRGRLRASAGHSRTRKVTSRMSPVLAWLGLRRRQSGRRRRRCNAPSKDRRHRDPGGDPERSRAIPQRSRATLSDLERSRAICAIPSDLPARSRAILRGRRRSGPTTTASPPSPPRSNTQAAKLKNTLGRHAVTPPKYIFPRVTPLNTKHSCVTPLQPRKTQRHPGPLRPLKRPPILTKIKKFSQ